MRVSKSHRITFRNNRDSFEAAELADTRRLWPSCRPERTQG